MTSTENTIRDEFAQLEDDWESASRYLSIFIDESRQTLDELTTALLALEAGGGRECIEQLFIAAHRIKGSAASIGLNRPAKLAHLMEDLLQMLVYDGRALAPKEADGLLACTDGLRQYINALCAGKPEVDHFDVVAQQLLDARVASGIPPVSHEAPAETVAASPGHEKADEKHAAAVHVVKSAAPAGELHLHLTPDLHRRVSTAVRDEDSGNVLVGVVVFEPALPLVGLKARLICSKLANLGEIRYSDPPVAEIESLDDIPAIRFGLATERTAADVQQLLHVAGVQEIAVEPLTLKRAAAKEKEVVPSRTSVTEPAAKPAETLRVDVERLDRLMNLAGQLAIGKARVAQIGDKLKAAVVGSRSVQTIDHFAAELKRVAASVARTAETRAADAEQEEVSGAIVRLEEHLQTMRQEAETLSQMRAHVNHLFETIHLLDSVSDGIRQSVMDMRMLPIGPLFTRFHRVIRDLNRANGKDVRLVISGEKTELDKRMIDELGDPMIHLIRNAADHGIESPEVRAAAGKRSQGTISLDAFHRGSSIVIRVSDDGKGLDANRIRTKAIEKGLVSAADAELMTPQQIFQFIWLPGFSTAEKVTDVSGRGVGMDIVRSRIKDLNGTVDVDSEPGRGTSFTIRLPLTLAVLPSLMVEIDNDVFAIPLESVAEIVCVKRNDMRTVHGHWTVPIRERMVAILRLNNLFRWQPRESKNAAGECDGVMLVIIGEGHQQLGLAVDNVIGEEDVVIKSIADNYRNVAGIAGASILGDGRISLILDPPTLIEMASRPAHAAGRT